MYELNRIKINYDQNKKGATQGVLLFIINLFIAISYSMAKSRECTA